MANRVIPPTFRPGGEECLDAGFSPHGCNPPLRPPDRTLMASVNLQSISGVLCSPALACCPAKRRAQGFGTRGRVALLRGGSASDERLRARSAYAPLPPLASSEPLTEACLPPPGRPHPPSHLLSRPLPAHPAHINQRAHQLRSAPQVKEDLWSCAVSLFNHSLEWREGVCACVRVHLLVCMSVPTITQYSIILLYLSSARNPRKQKRPPSV